jgi:hypothetical protein
MVWNEFSVVPPTTPSFPSLGAKHGEDLLG